MSDLRTSVVAAGCVLRGLPLFFHAAPRTPLRVLCIVALDTLHVLRHSRPLPRARVRELAAFVDFQACTNAVLDHKDHCERKYRALRQRLEKAGLGSWIDEYLGRLQELERRRPPIGNSGGGDRRRFEETRSYREAVVRLSLATLIAMAENTDNMDDGIRAIDADVNQDALFRIAMQCQIIDDVLDHSADVAAGLPSFLTASESLSDALSWTTGAARAYGRCHAILPLRTMLRAVTVMTTVVVRVAQLRHHEDRAPRTLVAGESQ